VDAKNRTRICFIRIWPFPVDEADTLPIRAISASPWAFVPDRFENRSENRQNYCNTQSHHAHRNENKAESCRTSPWKARKRGGVNLIADPSISQNSSVPNTTTEIQDDMPCAVVRTTIDLSRAGKFGHRAS
jgi:hypothetical protein